SFAVLGALLMAGLLAVPVAMAESPAKADSGGRHRKNDHAATAAPAAAPADTPATAPTPPPGELLDKVVAIVNDGIVTQGQLDDATASALAKLKQNGTKAPPDDVLRSQVLDYLVMQELQLQHAKSAGITVPDEQLNTYISNIAKEHKLTLSQLPDAIAAQGGDYASWRDERRNEILLDLLHEREVVSHISITPRELDQFMERIKKQPGENDEYDVSDILIALPSEATQAQVDEVGKKAQQVYERVTREDFAQVAVADSNAPTALQGGELGWRKGPDLPSCCAEAIVALKPGEISRPIATSNGFHIVKLNGVRLAEGDPVQDQVHVRHILIKPDALQDDATVRLKLAGVRQRILNGEDFAVFASSMSQDSGSAVNGGELDWASPSSFVGPFADTVASLKDGEISEPFKTQFGWHIVQLLGRRRIDVTEDNLRDRAFQQLRKSKDDEETETWLREMRDEAYIDTKL
ncbi:MAG TPA: peptidylprolyl isomerase, partial [Steroidobacteraceae bacterium]|nr:peptidylprolyl isomerase [Steroidobacteraceae bacterium]